MPRFEKKTRGVSAPYSGLDTADHPEDLASVCVHCGHVGHEHERERVYPDDGPAGSYHYEHRCPTGGDA